MNRPTDNTRPGAAKPRRGAGMRLLPLCAAVLMLIITACSSVDCPLNSLVYTQYALRTAAGQTDTLHDTLTVSTTRADGNDSVLINRDVAVTGFSLPISYGLPQDVFYFETIDTLTKAAVIDTVTITKETTPHFESVECAPTYFHKITSVVTTNHAIDSIVINHPDVDYDTSRKHFHIYFRHRN